MEPSKLDLPRIARRRKSYEERTGMLTRAAKIAAKAVTEVPVFVEDADGHRIRQWKPEEMLKFTHDEVALALRGRNAVEQEEMLEHVPPSAIKYATTKGWIRPAHVRGLYMVTEKARFDLKLPDRVGGRRIRFA